MKDSLLKEHNDKLKVRLLDGYDKEIEREIANDYDSIEYFKENIDNKASWRVAIYMSEDIFYKYILGKYEIDCEEILEYVWSLTDESYFAFIFGGRFYDFECVKEQ